jgi:hypothetical protein
VIKALELECCDWGEDDGATGRSALADVLQWQMAFTCGSPPVEDGSHWGGRSARWPLSSPAGERAGPDRAKNAAHPTMQSERRHGVPETSPGRGKPPCLSLALGRPWSGKTAGTPHGDVARDRILYGQAWSQRRIHGIGERGNPVKDLFWRSLNRRESYAKGEPCPARPLQGAGIPGSRARRRAGRSLISASAEAGLGPRVSFRSSRGRDRSFHRFGPNRSP